MQLKELCAEKTMVNAQQLRDVLLLDEPMAATLAQGIPIESIGDGKKGCGKPSRPKTKRKYLARQFPSGADARQGKRARSRTIVPAEHVLISDAQDFLRTSSKVPRAEISAMLRALADKLDAIVPS